MADAGSHAYEFLDCGAGRRLERFSDQLVIRPAPAAFNPPALSRQTWERANLSFTPGKGWNGEAPGDWQVALGGALLRLRPAGGGQVGVFPEHASVCSLLEERLAARTHPNGSIKALNLFAHTGLATVRLAALAPVGEMVHADASKRAVSTARENAKASGLEKARIRWLVDDAVSLVKREARRGNRYGLILADPPSHGRDKKSGRDWNFQRDIVEFLELTAGLLEPSGLLCLTCHSGGWEAGEASGLMDRIPGLPPGRLTKKLTLASTAGGNSLDAGFAVLAFG